MVPVVIQVKLMVVRKDLGEEDENEEDEAFGENNSEINDSIK